MIIKTAKILYSNGHKLKKWHDMTLLEKKPYVLLALGMFEKAYYVDSYSFTHYLN